MKDVIVLNGGSSSGKSSIARALQEILPTPWLTFGVDDLIEALPGRGDDPRSGLRYDAHGTVILQPPYPAREDAWYAGLAGMARSGAPLILDEVLLSGAAGQGRLRAALAGLAVLWVGVHCEPAVAAAREAGRTDRVRGMAMAQAVAVHAGVVYDVEVDTTDRSATACARDIAERLNSRAAGGR
jgi:chloramphenicol 3-O phosphotransferase